MSVFYTNEVAENGIVHLDGPKAGEEVDPGTNL
jgi:hypothetical protein